MFSCGWSLAIAGDRGTGAVCRASVLLLEAGVTQRHITIRRSHGFVACFFANESIGAEFRRDPVYWTRYGVTYQTTRYRDKTDRSTWHCATESTDWNTISLATRWIPNRSFTTLVFALITMFSNRKHSSSDTFNVSHVHEPGDRASMLCASHKAS